MKVSRWVQIHTHTHTHKKKATERLRRKKVFCWYFFGYSMKKNTDGCVRMDANHHTIRLSARHIHTRERRVGGERKFFRNCEHGGKKTHAPVSNQIWFYRQNWFKLINFNWANLINCKSGRINESVCLLLEFEYIAKTWTMCRCPRMNSVCTTPKHTRRCNIV